MSQLIKSPYFYVALSTLHPLWRTQHNLSIKKTKWYRRTNWAYIRQHNKSANALEKHLESVLEKISVAEVYNLKTLAVKFHMFSQTNLGIAKFASRVFQAAFAKPILNFSCLINSESINRAKSFFLSTKIFTRSAKHEYLQCDEIVFNPREFSVQMKLTIPDDLLTRPTKVFMSRGKETIIQLEKKTKTVSVKPEKIVSSDDDSSEDTSEVDSSEDTSEVDESELYYNGKKSVFKNNKSRDYCDGVWSPTIKINLADKAHYDELKFLLWEVLFSVYCLKTLKIAPEILADFENFKVLEKVNDQKPVQDLIENLAKTIAENKSIEKTLEETRSELWKTKENLNQLKNQSSEIQTLKQEKSVLQQRLEWKVSDYVHQQKIIDRLYAENSKLQAEVSESIELNRSLTEKYDELYEQNYVAPVVPDDAAGNNPLTCVVCRENPKTHAVVPCHHYCCCKTCITNIQASNNPHCPVCRGNIKALIRVFV